MASSSRVVYSVTLPASLQAAQVQAWLRAMSGLPRFATLALELWATGSGLTYRLVAPKAHADYVAGQLRTLVPGARVVKVSRTMPEWTTAVELGITDLAHTLQITSVEQLGTSLLGSMQGLSSGETVLWQVVIRPAVSEAFTPVLATLFNEDRGQTKDRQVKLSEPNFLAVLRLAVQADNGRTRALLARVRSALAATRSPHAAFRKKLTFSRSRLLRRIDHASGSVLYGAQFSVSELSGLIAWPIGSPHVAGLPRAMTRQLPAVATVPKSGLVVGTSTFPGDERPVAISYKEVTKHVHLLGPTGSGKTTLAANLAKQTMDQGYGLIVMESKGDLFNAVLDRVPRRRSKDVVVLDVNDTEYPVGFNVLNTGSSHSAVDELSALVTGLYGDHGGVYAPMLLYYGLHALAETPGHTFVDLPHLLTPQGPEEAAWREELVRNLQSREVRQFWQRYLDDKDKERDRMSTPVHNRIWQLAVRPEIRNIIGQSSSSFTFEEVLANNKILLVNLNGTRVGETAASITGTLLVNALWSAVRRVKKTKPSLLVIDEFQDFVNLAVNAADLLAKLRSYGVGVVLAHQELDQLIKVRGLEQAVLSNARTKVVYQTNARDARAMQREFGRLVSDDDFLNLGAYEAITRIATKDGVSTPITITTNPPSRKTNVANAVRLASRTTYGRPIAEVEAEIENRRRTSTSSRKRPKVGPQKWG